MTECAICGGPQRRNDGTCQDCGARFDPGFDSEVYIAPVEWEEADWD